MGGIPVNDRAVNLLENYEIEVHRTWKGRGTILCESDQGLLILKEYNGSGEKIAWQDLFLEKLHQEGAVRAERILKTKEGELTVQDQDRVTYIVKTSFEGRECNVREGAECMAAVSLLARMHGHTALTEADSTLSEGLSGISSMRMQGEYEKHNRELRRVRKFLREKSQKSDFELFLLKHYDRFLEQAVRIGEEAAAFEEKTGAGKELCFCHGDYQHHNILFLKGEEVSCEHMALINFEKCIPDHPVRDLYLFMRKLMEKGNWSLEPAERLLKAYCQERPLKEEDYMSLYYRFSYPEKFWKIVNFYYNSGKAWIPERNMEKLKKLLAQEERKQSFLENYKSQYGCFSF